jgi:chorismate mutase
VDPAADPTVQQYRREITDCDEAIVAALNRRITLVGELFAHKRANGYPISDPDREQRLLARLEAANEGPLSRERLAELVALVLDICRTDSAQPGDSA